MSGSIHGFQISQHYLKVCVSKYPNLRSILVVELLLVFPVSSAKVEHALCESVLKANSYALLIHKKQEMDGAILLKHVQRMYNSHA